MRMNFRTSNNTLPRFFRFLLVGGFSTLFYGVVCGFLIDRQITGPTGGAALGYLASIPLNYLLQRTFTFRSINEPTGEALRYLIVHAANFSLSTMGMYLRATVFGLDYRLGILATMVFVPILVFVMLNRWVFAQR
jgi:putative flippase GtrA